MYGERRLLGWRFGKIPTMRFAVVLVILPAVAFGVTVETLPQSEYADTEVSSIAP